MNPLYDNWKQLFSSPDFNNTLLALHLVDNLDWALIEQDIANFYITVLWKHRHDYWNGQPFFDQLETLLKKQPMIFPEPKKVLTSHYHLVKFIENVETLFLQLNPKLNAQACFAHLFERTRSAFSDFLNMPKIQHYLTKEAVIAIAETHEIYRPKLSRLVLENISPLLTYFDFVQDLQVLRFGWSQKNLDLLYHLPRLGILQLGHDYINKLPHSGETMHLDLERLPEIRVLKLTLMPTVNIKVSGAEKLHNVQLDSCTEAQAEAILATAQDVMFLILDRYRGARLPRSIAKLSKLRMLRIETAQQKLDLGVLASLEQLQILRLSNLKFEGLPLLPNLRILSANYCELEVLPTIVGDFALLGELDLSYNRINFINRRIWLNLLMHLTDLKLIDSFANSALIKKVQNLVQDMGNSVVVVWK